MTVRYAIDRKGAVRGRAQLRPTRQRPSRRGEAAARLTRATAEPFDGALEELGEGHMLSRLILLALQLVIGWFAAPYIVRYVPNLGGLQLFVYAVVFAVLAWVVGLILSQVLRELGMPSSSTLVASLVVALIGAALITWLPGLVPDLAGTMRQVPALVYPLIGAVIGYHIRR